MDHLDPEHQDEVLARQQRADVLWRLQRALEQEPRAGASRWLRAALLAIAPIIALSAVAPLYIGLSVGLTFAILDLTQIFSGETRLLEATRDAANLDDMRALGMLLEAHTVGNAATRSCSGDGLRRILPQVTPDDREWITRPMVRRIDGLLIRFEPDTIWAALCALEQVGDSESLERIRALLGMTRLQNSPDSPHLGKVMVPWTRDFPRLEELALKVEASLESRLAEEREQAVLLRPAQAEVEHLLRPSVSTPANPPEELLRPATLHSEPTRRDA